MPFPEGADWLWGLPSLLFNRNAVSFWGISLVGRAFEHVYIVPRAWGSVVVKELRY